MRLNVMSLIFYQIEEKVYRKSYNTHLDRKKIIRLHQKLCKKYHIITKLRFDNRTQGYYDIDTDIICLPENATLGLLIHEFSHAYEQKRYNETLHKNRLFQIINEINLYAEKAL